FFLPRANYAFGRESGTRSACRFCRRPDLARQILLLSTMTYRTIAIKPTAVRCCLICRNAASCGDELVSLHHSMTSSARASSDGGIVSPIVFAVELLMTNSNRVASRTGNSLG